LTCVTLFKHGFFATHSLHTLDGKTGFSPHRLPFYFLSWHPFLLLIASNRNNACVDPSFVGCLVRARRQLPSASRHLAAYTGFAGSMLFFFKAWSLLPPQLTLNFWFLTILPPVPARTCIFPSLCPRLSFRSCFGEAVFFRSGMLSFSSFSRGFLSH